MEGESVPENELDESLGFRVWRVWRVRVYLRMNLMRRLRLSCEHKMDKRDVSERDKDTHTGDIRPRLSSAEGRIASASIV